MNDFTGHTIGRYQIMEQIDQGGMAVVYMALDTRLDSKVAVKVINKDFFPPADLSKILRFFEDEAKLMAGLNHPNIVKVIDYGEYEGYPYLVMPYMSGGTLKKLIGNPMPWQEAVGLIIPIANALEYAHRSTLSSVHRDIKPSNILLTESGEPILTDFGLADILGGSRGKSQTGSGIGLLGTPEYMAPEQGLGKQVDGRADIYSLGLVLYEMVTGRQPYTADNPLAVVLKQINEPLPPPHLFVQGLPDKVESILFKALEKSPDNRYQSMEEFARALQNSLTDGSGRDPKWTFVKLLLLFGGFILVLLTILWLARSSTTQGPEITQTTPDITATSTETPSPTHGITLSPTPIKLTDTPAPPPCSECIFIPAGVFIMGATENDKNIVSGSSSLTELAGEKPAHEVILDAYWMDRLEVSNDLFAQFVAETNYVTDAERYQSASTYDKNIKNFGEDPNPSANWRNPDGSGRGIADLGNYPVVQMSWKDAVAFCSWRGGRLPTEAEWEKAGRGENGYVYPWGNDYNSKILNGADKSDGYSFAAPVDAFPDSASVYGLLNMSGNVAEWVQDYYSENYYTVSPLKNPTGPSEGKAHLLKGGSWFSSSNGNRLSNRITDVYKDDIMQNYGFRCAYDD